MIDVKATKRPSPKGKAGQIKTLVWIGGGGLVLLIASFLIWTKHFHHYTPMEAWKDLRAASQVEHSPDPVQLFLELRYGPQTDPANRRKAFVDFFSAAHIEGLYLIVGDSTDSGTKTLVSEVAQIIKDYRETMSPAEKADLGAYFRSDTGRAHLREATTCYQSKDVQFRAVTTPVVRELLTTLTSMNGL
jgi:hypothetical protein